MYAILDSVSCAGAYKIIIRPGQTTVATLMPCCFSAKQTWFTP